MTSENSLSTDRERAALKRRLLAALADAGLGGLLPDRKSTRLNSSHT